MWVGNRLRKTAHPECGACDWGSSCSSMSKCRAELWPSFSKMLPITTSHPQEFLHELQTIRILLSLRMHENMLCHNLPQPILSVFLMLFSLLLTLKKCIFFISDCIFLVKHSQETNCMNFVNKTILTNNQSDYHTKIARSAFCL